MIDAIRKHFALTECSVGRFASLKAGGMSFAISSFRAAGLGNVSEIRASGMLGLMKMDTVVVDLFERDAPLFSYDLIRAMGRDTLILELYDTLLGKRPSYTEIQAVANGAAELPDYDLGCHWYDGIKLPESLAKRGGRKYAARFDALTAVYFEAFLRAAAEAPACDPLAKRKKAGQYVDGLLEHGGPATDAFVRLLGREQTSKLFHTAVFGEQA